MKHKSWTLALSLGAVAGLSMSCGSEGSLASSGSTDWSFDGMNQTGARAGASTKPGGGASGSGTAIGGGSPSASGGASASTPGGSAVALGGSSNSGAGTGTGTGTAGSTTGATGRYHQLANWVGPEANNPNHHGRVYFLGNAHKDENGLECSSCHGKSYEGDAGPACASCHSEWRSSCTFCHGTANLLGGAPPRGVWDETSTASLAVGRHSAHLSAGSSHQAFACGTCHQVPEANDVDHTLSYQASNDLSTPGHHGDVMLTSAVPGMVWNVGATSGTPVSTRGSCVGGCHSDGRGGPPAKTPSWAGGNWTNSCANCHSDRPKTGHHDHALGEGGTCANCHAGSTTNQYSADSHLNGKTDYLGTVSGQGMTLTADASCASGVRCNGTCHGNNEGHNNKCW
jgi:predicted CxxxxCH...CXXCH cytochrome family protein